MGTPSTIAIEHADGRVEQIQCHWDGGLSRNGATLMDHYSDPAVVRVLISMGNLSILAEQIFPMALRRPHDFNYQQRDVCVFYGRDRAEPDQEAVEFRDFGEYMDDHMYTGFEYIMRLKDDTHDSPVWYVKTDADSHFIELDQALLSL
jgi:hypothetical protein